MVKWWGMTYMFVRGFDDFKFSKADMERRTHKRAICLSHYYNVNAPTQSGLYITTQSVR